MESDSILTVDGRGAHNHSLDNVWIRGAGVQDKFVDVAMEGMVWQGGEFFDLGPVVVFPVRPGAESRKVVVGIMVCQNARATGMEPVSRPRFRVALEETCGDGLGCTLVV